MSVSDTDEYILVAEKVAVYTNMAERSPDVSCAIRVAMNSLLRHRRMTEMELSKSTKAGWATGLCGQHR